MQANRKFLVMAALCVLVITAVSFTSPQPPEGPKAKNLKVLPKDISHEQLDKIMDGFKAALGVKCNFCHSPSKDDPKKLDFASDAKSEKDIARHMMKMTLKINKKFFEVKGPAIGDTSLMVSCSTCHHGEPHPERKK
jgi:ABC-type uncharacterized transport system substrate-binding protein